MKSGAYPEPVWQLGLDVVSLILKSIFKIMIMLSRYYELSFIQRHGPFHVERCRLDLDVKAMEDKGARDDAGPLSARYHQGV